MLAFCAFEPGSSPGQAAASRLTSLTENMAGTTNDLTQTFAYNPFGGRFGSHPKTLFRLTPDRHQDLVEYELRLEPPAREGAQSMNCRRSPTGSAFTDTYVANALNQITAVNGASLVYDSNGNLTNDGAKTFGYDASNRLKSAAPNAGGTSVALSYDPPVGEGRQTKNRPRRTVSGICVL